MSDEMNGPSPMGIALGENMARFADKAEQDWLAKMGWIPVRCKGCAFRKGTWPNQSLGTMANATKCVMEGETFYCHHDRAPNGEGRRICAGWMLLNDNHNIKMPWEYVKAMPQKHRK